MKKLLAKIGTYEKDGETKNRYAQLGVIQENQHGEYMLLDPSVSLSGILALQNAMTGEVRKNVMVSIFEQDNQQRPPQAQQAPQTAPPQRTAPPSGDVFDDDIPF